MPATTIDTVETAMRAAIEATTPRIVEQSGTATWRHYRGPRHPGTDARWFRFQWDDEGYTVGGFMGPQWVETDYTLSIFVDYGGLPEHRVKVIAGDDLYQLRDVLNRLKSTVGGLRWVEAIDWGFSSRSSDENQAQVLLQYLVRIMKERA
ncbi:MAG: hypothetical protein IPK74_39485 [Deltaproteobacteria bacterium]|nr:hypothetical protein [Deltaproteobacteria bacterium]